MTTMQAQIAAAKTQLEEMIMVIRVAAMERIMAIGTTETARVLGMAEVGVESLSRKKRWGFDEAVRVATALGLRVSVTVGG